MRAPEPTANLRSEGDHRTKVAARLIRRRTSVGFHPDGDGSHTYALRSEFTQLVHYISQQGTRDRMRGNAAVHRRTLGTGDDSARTGGNVYACDNLIVPFELIMKGKFAPRPTVKFNIIISRNSQRFSVCGERVVCNWVMEKVMNVRGNHGFKRQGGRSSSLLPL